jgi:8-amino-7-oxononanoate synthase
VKSFRARLDELESAGLLRTLRAIQGAPGARVRIEGRDVVNFASNNYLALAEDPRVREAAAEAAREWGAGATASRLLGGTLEVHGRLEDAVAKFKRTEAAAVFPSGWHANTGLLPALAGPEDTVLLDRLAHASLVDGARLTRASFRVFRHNDLEDLEGALRRRPARGAVWIVTESVFSMDGDTAPLRGIVSLAKQHGASVYVDEAHATGVYGPDGRGWVNAEAVETQVDVCMGTFSKALGSLGGFACGSYDFVEWVHNRCRSFIYSTALPPASAAAALKALEIAQAEPQRRERVFALAARLRKGLGLPEGGPVVPLVVGGEKETLELSRRFWEAGIFAPAVRPPTVPKGTSRIRFSVTAGHTESEIDRALDVYRSTPPA